MAITKKEIAKYKALNKVGLTVSEIAVRMKRDPKTVRKYLRSDVYNDPGVEALVDVFTRYEVAYLYLMERKVW